MNFKQHLACKNLALAVHNFCRLQEACSDHRKLDGLEQKQYCLCNVISINFVFAGITVRHSVSESGAN